MKTWYQSKTIWLAILQALVIILVALEIQYPALAVVGILKMVLDVVLRGITTQTIK